MKRQQLDRIVVRVILLCIIGALLAFILTGIAQLWMVFR